MCDIKVIDITKVHLGPLHYKVKNDMNRTQVMVFIVQQLHMIEYANICLYSMVVFPAVLSSMQGI